MPTIETCQLEKFNNLDTALQQIDTYDWIAFTSRNGIDAFFKRWEDLNLNPMLLAKCRFCGIGMDVEKLVSFGVKVDYRQSNKGSHPSR
jgi:uroporphyrinogen-III synthase